MKRILAVVVAGLIMPSVAGAQAPNWSQRGAWARSDVKIPIPFKVFDNIYYVGTDHVSSYLVTTSDGLVLIDATNASAVDGVLANIRKLGFDPRRIKYVFITQAHQDHYGGAPKLKEATGATIGMSRQDLEFLEEKKLRPNDPEYQWSGDPAPARDLLIGDDKVIEVGDNVFKFHFTPGHTPGSLSMEYYAHDGNQRYRVLTPGGLGFSYGPDWNDEYIASTELLKKRGPWDVVLSNHPFMMPVHLFERMQNVDRSKQKTHPLAIGPAAINNWLDSLLKIAREKAEYERTSPRGDVRKGATEFSTCVNCHGQHAEGGFGPDLAGRDLPWITFKKAVRQPWGIMPAFRAQQKPDQALADIRAYLNTLRPTTTLGEWHWRRAPETAPLGQRLYMNFAGCGQCHEPEGKFPRARLGVAARDVTFDYFKRQIYQHYERWPKGTMPLYSPERLPESVLREMYQWLVEELGLRPWIAGALTLGERRGDKTSYTVTVLNGGEKGKGLAAEGLTVFVRIPAGSSVVAAAGAGYEGALPLAKLGLEPALRRAPHPHDDSGAVERPRPDLSRDVAVWKLARIAAGEQITLSLTLAGPAPTPELLNGFDGSTVHWSSPGRRPAGNPPRMVYRDLRIPDQGDHELITVPRAAGVQ